MNKPGIVWLALCATCITWSASTGVAADQTAAANDEVGRDVPDRARDAEREYRRRLARLRRLRDIATVHRESSRLADLDSLYRQLRTLHDERLLHLRGLLAEDRRPDFDSDIRQGREPVEWLHEHRERSIELLAEYRTRRAERAERRIAAGSGAPAEAAPGGRLASSGRTDRAAERQWAASRRRVTGVADRPAVAEHWQREASDRAGARPVAAVAAVGAAERVPSQQEADALATALIGDDNAEAEYDLLRREIERLRR